MLIRFPFLLVWNLLRNLLRFPFVLLQALFGLLGKDENKFVRLVIRKGLPYWEKSSWLQWVQSEPLDPTMDQWRDIFEKLGQKKSIDGVVLEVRALNAGWPAVDELRAMLIKFRETGKKVVLYPHQLTTAEFYLATGADQVLISPATPVMLNAPAFQSFFFGAFLKEVGVTFDVQRMGAHKNAPENMTRAFPSPTYRGDLYELLYDFTQQLYGEMAKGREDDAERLRQMFQWGIFSPEEALQHELVDAIRFSERLEAYIQTQEAPIFQYPEHPLAPPKEDEEAQTESENAKPTTGEEVTGEEVTGDGERLEPSEQVVGAASGEAQAKSEQASEVTAFEEERLESSSDTSEPDGSAESIAGVVEAEPRTEETAGESEEMTEGQEVESSGEAEALLSSEVSEPSVEAQESVGANVAEPGAEASEPGGESESAAEGSESGEEPDLQDDYLVDLDDVDLEGLVWWRWTQIRRKPVVAVIPVAGTIVDEGSGQSRGEQAVRPWIVAAIEEAQRNPQIKGVVLWVNSPGGSGFASEAIWWALKRLGKDKPVVTYMDSYAASGGYYVACGTQKVVASPWCITGSIGVFGGKVSVDQLVQRLKIGYSVVGESHGLRMMSPFRPATELDKQRWLEQLALFYDRFLLRVAEHRDMTIEEVHEKAQGKVYLGEHAREIGLVDQTGHLSDAVAVVCESANISVPQSLYWFRPSQRFRLSDLREAMSLGLGSSFWRMLPRQQQPASLSTTGLGGPSAELVQQVLSEPNLSSLWQQKAGPGLSSAVLQQLPIQEYLNVMQMVAGGDIAAWCDLRWL